MQQTTPKLPLDQIRCGDNAELIRQLPDSSIHMVITSPPYFQQRNYGGDGRGKMDKVRLSLLEATHTNLKRIGQTDVVTIEDIISILNYHFFKDYRVAGASRLPVLAVYTIYEMFMTFDRYQGKTLLPLKSHTTSDVKSRSIGDIEVVDENGDFFEAVEIKHNIPISPAIIGNAYKKFAETSVSRYYFLTTANLNVDEPERVNLFVRQLRNQHGCEVIIDSALTSLKYYLRLLSDPKLFLTYYSQNLQSDFSQSTDIKATHLQYWNELLNSVGV